MNAGWWEVAHCLNPTFNDAGEDPLQDGLSNLQKYRLGLDPNAADTGGPNGLPYGLVYDYLGVNHHQSRWFGNRGGRGQRVAGHQLARQLAGGRRDIYALSRRGAVDFQLTVLQSRQIVLKVIVRRMCPAVLGAGLQSCGLH